MGSVPPLYKTKLGNLSYSELLNSFLRTQPKEAFPDVVTKQRKFIRSCLAIPYCGSVWVNIKNIDDLKCERGNESRGIQRSFLDPGLRYTIMTANALYNLSLVEDIAPVITRIPSRITKLLATLSRGCVIGLN